MTQGAVRAVFVVRRRTAHVGLVVYPGRCVVALRCSSTARCSAVSCACFRPKSVWIKTTPRFRTRSVYDAVTAKPSAARVSFGS